MIKKTLPYITVLLLTYAQVNFAAVTNTINIGFQDTAVMNQTLVQLSSNNIWFKKKNNNLYTFKEDDVPTIIEVTKKITNDIIPNGRSANYSKYLHDQFVKKLTDANIPYNFVKYGDLMQTETHRKQGLTTQWVVWPQKYTNQVNKIQKNIEASMLNKLNTEGAPH